MIYQDEADLKNLYTRLHNCVRSRWKRSLPWGEMITDRWQRAKMLGFGKDTSIYHMSYVYGDVKVGENTWIGPFALLDGTGGLEIGSNCSISAGVHIYTHDTVKWAISGGKEPYKYAPVKIGNNCFIGAGAIVLKGVTIEAGSVVPAGEVVRRDVKRWISCKKEA